VDLQKAFLENFMLLNFATLNVLSVLEEHVH